MNKRKRNKIITTIGWTSVITSVPWIIGISVIAAKFKDQRQSTNQLKLEKEQSKTKNKQSDDKIKALEIKTQMLAKQTNQLKNKNTQQEKIHHATLKNSQIKIEKLDQKIKQLQTSLTLIEKKYSHELPQEIINIVTAKSILDKLVTTTTKEITKSPTKVTYPNWTNFIAKTALTFNEEEQKKLSKVSIKVEVQNDDNFQIITLKINKKNKTITKSTIKVTGFWSTKVEADINAALAKVKSNSIKGDKNKLASSMTSKLIIALNGFPENTNGIHFSAITDHDYDDTKGELKIVLVATKGSVSGKKEIIIKGFKIKKFDSYKFLVKRLTDPSESIYGTGLFDPDNK